MMFYDFQTTTHGKWILAGEHAVLRGHPALVFPVPDRMLTLRHQNSSEPAQADCMGNSGADMRDLFWRVLAQAAAILNLPMSAIRGRFELACNIPIGVGLGASAALSVAVARWFAAHHTLPLESIPNFARELEDLFHGKSSGLDIAGVAASDGVYFKQGDCTPIKQVWDPIWRLSSCGQVGLTSDCIKQVQSLWNINPKRAALIDQQMADSVERARAALLVLTPRSMHDLVDAIQSANDCFQQWGLVSERLQHHMQTLRDAGALAVKPTGSGGGGYAVSLWDATQ